MRKHYSVLLLWPRALTVSLVDFCYITFQTAFRDKEKDLEIVFQYFLSLFPFVYTKRCQITV